MLPGPPINRRCSACSGLVNQPTLMSGNNTLATWWSDGKVEAPFMPEYPQLVACPHCGARIWIAELEEAGDDAVGDDYGELSFAELLEYADGNALEAEREVYIRVRAWWQGNDTRRRGDGQLLTDAEIGNLEQLLSILDETEDDQRLMKAEGLRELGKFTESMQLLEHEFDSGYQPFVSAIRGFASEQETPVEVIVGRDPALAFEQNEPKPRVPSRFSRLLRFWKKTPQ